MRRPISCWAIVQNLVTPTIQYQGDVATWRDGFFVLDNWQASRKLTINYGHPL